MKLKNSHGFSMVEAMVAAVILSIGVVGVLATMSSQKTPAVGSDRKLQAALVAKRFLEDLRTKVDATTYDTGPLALTVNVAHPNVVIDGYTISYTVTDAGNSARKVDMTVTWP